jgi:hypothetical protein
LTALRVAYGHTGRDMHAVPADSTEALPAALCGRQAIPGAGDYRTARTTGPKCPTCQIRSKR